MGVLSSFERRLSGIVEGTFAKVFKGWAEPVQIAGALTRELDNRRVRSARQSLVPNTFVVDLSARDHERLAPYEENLTDELGAMLREYAQEQRYSFAGPVTVRLAKDGELATGVFRIHAEVNADGTVEAPPRSFRPPVSAPAGPAAPAAVLPSEPAVYDVMGDPGLGRDEPEPAPSRASLVVSYAGGDLEASDRTYPLTGAVTRIGRAHDVDLRVDDSAVSRNHAEIRRLPDGKGHVVVDLGSTNGTTVNGRRIQTWELREGDRIQVGSATLAYLPGRP